MEPLRSQRVSITPERKQAYIDFVTTLPRKCSPTVCGLLSTSTPKNNHQTYDPLADISMQSASPSPNLTRRAKPTFEWSIDDLSVLYGGEFSNVNELEHFHEYESRTTLSVIHEQESQLFFSQETIHPSPEKNVNNSDRIQIESKKIEHPRSTNEFLAYLEDLTKDQFAQTNKRMSSDTIECHSPSQDKSCSAMNISSVASEHMSMTMTPVALASKGLRVISDTACEKMKLSIENVKSKTLINENLVQFANQYLDFSHISPIGRRTPVTSIGKRSFQNIDNQFFDGSPISSANYASKINCTNLVEIEDFSEHLTFEHAPNKKIRDKFAADKLLSPDLSVAHSNGICDADCSCSKSQNSSKDSSKEVSFQFKTPKVNRNRIRRAKLQFDRITSTPN